MNIDLQQPQPFDLVDSTILISGNAVAFEGQLSLSVEEGHDGVEGVAMVGGTSLRQFQASIEIPPTTEFRLSRLFLTLSDDGGADPGEGIVPSVTVPILYGPLILPGYTGYLEHTVVSGDTLTSIAQRYYDGSSDFNPIVGANQHIISDPNLIFAGQVLRVPLNF